MILHLGFTYPKIHIGISQKSRFVDFEPANLDLNQDLDLSQILENQDLENVWFQGLTNVSSSTCNLT